MDAATIRQVGIEFDRLDISLESERYMENRSDVAAIEAARTSAHARMEGLTGAIRDGARPSGAAIADALLADSTTALATLSGTSKEAMEAERASLREGLTQFRRRLDDADLERQTIEREAKSKAAMAARPLVDELVLEAVDAMERLASTYAALSAVQLATGAGAKELGTVREVMKAGFGPYKLAQWRSELEVPADVAAVLRRLDGKSEALKPRFAQSVPMP